MISVFDVDALRSLLKDFYEITRIRITVFDVDMRELVSWPEQFPPFCRAIRSTDAGSAACRDCDRVACAAAAKQRGAYIYRCHAGLTEAVVPLYVGEVLVGYLWCGHVFSYPSFEEGIVEIVHCCTALPLASSDLEAACAVQPIITEEYVRSAARILHATASYLILEHMATLREDSEAACLDRYLTAHFTQPITAEKVCDALRLSRSQLYRLSSQLYGCGVSRHVRTLRIAYAKKLLANKQEMSIAEVAGACGYSDYNYFIAVFTRETGVSPGIWRRNSVI